MDFRQKVMGERESALKTLAGAIPGYGEYQQKEKRRDADKFLRTYLADQMSEQRNRTNGIQSRLVRSGRLSAVGAIDRLNTKFILFIDSIRTASYGYAGWFDSITINEGDLDNLYEFDASLAEGIKEVASTIDALEAAISANSDIDVAVDKIAAAIDRQNQRFRQRQEYVLEGKKSQAQFPGVLKAKAKLSPEAILLWNLRLKDAVTVNGIDYLIEGRVATSRSDNEWRRYLLKDGSAEQWLWIGEGGSTMALLQDTPAPQDLLKQDTLNLEGNEYKLDLESAGQVDVEGASGRSGNNYVRVRRLGSGDGKVLWIENWGTEVKALIGNPISTEEIKVWKK